MFSHVSTGSDIRKNYFLIFGEIKISSKKVL